MRILTKKQLELRTQELITLLRSEATAFLDASPEATAKRVAKQLNNYEYFCREYLPHYFTADSCDAHQYLYKRLEARGEPSAIAMPRAHAKSTHASLAYPLWQIVNGRRKFIVLISDTNLQASSFVRFLALELSQNERIRRDFGDLVGATWSDQACITSTGIMFLARGRGQAVRGVRNGPYRPDLIVCDDLENDRSVRNQELVNASIDWLRGSVLGAFDRGGLDGTLVVVGTRISTRSLLSHFLTADGWSGKVFSAELPGEKTLWPAKYSWSDLKRICAAMGVKAYRREYLNAPDDTGSAFRSEWIRYYDPSEVTAEAEAMRTAIYVDPSATDMGDYKAVIVLGRSRSGQDYVRRAWIRQTSIEHFLRAVAELYQEYQPEVIGFESNGFQTVLAEAWRRHCTERGINPPLVMVNNHQSKDSRISRLSVLVETGRIRFRRDDPDQETLIEQMLAYPSSAPDDGPDALEGAARLLDRSCVDYHYHPVGARQARRAALKEKYRGIYG